MADGGQSAGGGKEVREVAKNTGKGYREGAVRDRSQLKTPAGWIKRDSETDWASYLAARAEATRPGQARDMADDE